MAESAEAKIKQAAAGFGNESHRQKLLTLASTERHIIMSYPQDMTDLELLDFLGYLTHQFRAELPPVTGIVSVRGRVDA